MYIVQLTPEGRGAVATLLVEGAGARAVVDRHFRPKGTCPLRECPGNRPVFGRFGHAPGEEVIARCRSAESVELHCHGGAAAAAQIRRTLAAEGCRPVSWQDWAEARGEDPIAAAALRALAKARTQRTAAILLDQYQGALRRAMSDVEAAVARRDRTAARRMLTELTARASLGRHLVEPWRVVLAGRPNVGKSSLLNALVGYARAIVHPTAGTTRDAVAAGTAIEGFPVELIDTAGLPASGEQRGGGGQRPTDPIELAAVQRARQSLAAADLVVLMFDRSQSWSAADESLLRAWTEALVVHNKCDLAAAPGPRPKGVLTSALTGAGVGSLGEAIAARLVPEPPAPGAAVPFTDGHSVHLARLWAELGGEIA